MSKLIFGCGYLGVKVAQRWRAAGETVYAVSRSRSRADNLANMGLSPIVADVTRTSVKIPPVDGILFSVGYDRENSLVPIQEVYVQGIQNALSSVTDSVHRFIYISTTGVYSQTSGEWIDEAAECAPQRPGGIASYQAEQVLRNSSAYPRSIILRLAGIYGPDRVPRINELRAGVPLTAPHDGFLNLIHVDDAATIIGKCFEYRHAPALFNVSDGHPVERGEYIREIARILGAPPPTFQTPDASAPATHRATSDKRIHCDRIRKELGVTFQYPSYREGLAAILEGYKTTPSDGVLRIRY